MLTTLTTARPNASCNGFTAQTRCVVVQFGLVTMKTAASPGPLAGGISAGVLRVDVGDQQRHIGVHAVRRRVGADPEPGRGQLGLHLARVSRWAAPKRAAAHRRRIAPGSVGTSVMSAIAAGMPPRSSQLHTSP